MNFSNGNSFSEGNSFSGRQTLEPWWIRVLLAPVQDRGTT